MDSAVTNGNRHLPAFANVRKTEPAQTGAGKDDPEQTQGEAWDLAEQRMLLYLRILNVPVVQRMELALEALRQAAADPAMFRGEHPVPCAMRILRGLIAERNSFTSQDITRRLQQRCEQVKGLKAHRQAVPEPPSDPDATQDLPADADTVVVAPPLQRSCMVPGHIDRKPWRSFLADRFGRAQRKTTAQKRSKKGKERQ